MILIIGGTLLLGIVIGLVIERYKWVRSTKKGKFIEVDGDLYSVAKVKVSLTSCDKDQDIEKPLKSRHHPRGG